MDDAIWNRALQDQEQTRQRILGLEEEGAQQREHLAEIELFKKLFTVYDAALSAASDVDVSPSEERIPLEMSVPGWDAVREFESRDPRSA